MVVADDVLEMRHFVRAMLEDVPSCEVVAEAENGLRAVELVQELGPDVVVLDVDMPLLNGIEALARINEIAPETKVVMYSSTPEARAAASENGAFAYLEKGSEPEHLVEAVRRASAAALDARD